MYAVIGKASKSTGTGVFVSLLFYWIGLRSCIVRANKESYIPAKKFNAEFETHDELISQAKAFQRKLVSQGRRMDENSGDDEEFENFIAHKDSMTCTAGEGAVAFDQQVRGVCLGGWQVLEPWITPSLFYQFNGGNSSTTGIDMYTFCEVLGPEEGNRQLRKHWDTWVTEEIVRDLSENLHINSFRLPVGDWSFVPYGPYVGCTDGSLDYIDRLLEWADKYGVSVLFDIHAMKGSQNGFDNSGQARRVEWTSKFNRWPDGEVQTFMHWPIREANWMGEFNKETMTYPVIDVENIEHSLEVISNIVDRYKTNPAVLGLQPLNEPWEFTPEYELKKYYFDGYLIVKRGAPSWKYVMHDMFRFEIDLWGGFMAGCPDRALDTHIYQAWKKPSSRENFYQNACSWKRAIAEMEIAFGPVIVGEWSLATDNCAMYLNGFNDNIPGYPMLPCKYVACPKTGILDEPELQYDPGFYSSGPYGTGRSGPSFGFCPVGRDWVKENQLDSAWKHSSPESMIGDDDTDEVMSNLARKKICAFSGVGHGYYFWNFRTELPEYGWSYTLASSRGWIPTGSLYAENIHNACDEEDNLEYLCHVIRGEDNEYFIRKNVIGILHNESLSSLYVENLTTSELYDEADKLYNSYWRRMYLNGTTCDFSGTAILVVSESSATDDALINDQRTVNVRSLFLGPFAGLLILCLFGFIVRQSFGLNNDSNSDGEQMPILADKSADGRNGLPIKQG